MAEREKKIERKLPCTASVLAYPNCPHPTTQMEPKPANQRGIDQASPTPATRRAP